MKYRVCILTTLLCLLSLYQAYSQIIPMFEANEWSGTATMVYTVSAKGHFSEIRYEAKISKGKGTATTSERYHFQGKEVEETGQAQGSGITDLTISFLEDPPGYEISIPVPAATGSRTRTVKNGGSETTSFGHEESAIMIPLQPLGANTDVLSGQFVVRSNAGNDVQTFTWNFYRGPLDAEFVFGSLEHDTWLPRPGTDENTPGKKITVFLDIVDKNKKPAKFKAKYFELELRNTSKEPGIALNAPLNPSSNPMPDMKFLETRGAVISNNGQSVRLTAMESGSDDSVVVGSFDGGGYTTMVGYAVLENGVRVEGQLQFPGGKKEMDIPKRKAGSKIASYWLLNHGNPADDDDKERSKGNSNEGDGLTAYEEYRGIWSQGTWRQLDPRKKELAVRVDELELFKEGLEVLSDASEVLVIPLKKDELAEDRQLNKNVSEKIHEQYAMWLVNGAVDKALGENRPKEKKNKTPKDSDRVVVDVTKMQVAYAELKKALADSNFVIPFTLEHWIKTTTAHELAHGIGVDHHGPSSDESPRWIEVGQDMFRVYANDGKTEIKKRRYEIKGNIGIPGGDASGDLSCMMAYALFYQWALHKEPGFSTYYAVPVLSDGVGLCTSSKGTGINKSGGNKVDYFGDATDGNCLGKIKVRDE